MTVVKEKAVMQRFLKELVKDNGAASYGEENVRKNLELGAVEILLLSARLRKSRLTITVPECGHAKDHTVSTQGG